MTQNSKGSLRPYHFRSNIILKKFSSKLIENEVLNLTSEHPYSEYNLERKFQSKLYPYNNIFEQPEEELIDFKGKQQMEPNKFSSYHT